MRTSFVAAAAALAYLGATAAAPGALAQSSPSADQIINSLKPTGPIGSGTRGIRAVSGGDTSAAPAATSASAAKGAMHASAATTQAANPAVSLTVEFKTGSAELTPHAMHVLDELGRALTSTDLAKYRFRVEGHTDTVGTPDANKDLSEKRAQAVTAYLESKFGVPSARLESVGLGETELAVPTPPQTPEARNRRVQVVNLGA